MAKVLVIGVSRGIGLETVRIALRAGHSVRALARSAASIPIQNAGLDKVSGNALDSDTIRNALQGIEAVIQTLGVDVSPWAVFERTTLFSQSTRILVDAMKGTGLKRLIAVTGLGAGDSRGHRSGRSIPRIAEGPYSTGRRGTSFWACGRRQGCSPQGAGRGGDPTAAWPASRLSRPMGQPYRDCGLRQRPIHQGTQRTAWHGIDASVKKRASAQRTHREGHGADLTRGK